MNDNSHEENISAVRDFLVTPNIKTITLLCNCIMKNIPSTYKNPNNPNFKNIATQLCDAKSSKTSKIKSIDQYNNILIMLKTLAYYCYKSTNSETIKPKYQNISPYVMLMDIEFVKHLLNGTMSVNRLMKQYDKHILFDVKSLGTEFIVAYIYATGIYDIYIGSIHPIYRDNIIWSTTDNQLPINLSPNMFDNCKSSKNVELIEHEVIIEDETINISKQLECYRGIIKTPTKVVNYYKSVMIDHWINKLKSNLYINNNNFEFKINQEDLHRIPTSLAKIKWIEPVSLLKSSDDKIKRSFSNLTIESSEMIIKTVLCELPRVKYRYFDLTPKGNQEFTISYSESIGDVLNKWNSEIIDISKCYNKARLLWLIANNNINLRNILKHVERKKWLAILRIIAHYINKYKITIGTYNSNNIRSNIITATSGQSTESHSGDNHSGLSSVLREDSVWMGLSILMKDEFDKLKWYEQTFVVRTIFGGSIIPLFMTSKEMLNCIYNVSASSEKLKLEGTTECIATWRYYESLTPKCKKLLIKLYSLPLTLISRYKSGGLCEIYCRSIDDQTCMGFDNRLNKLGTLSSLLKMEKLIINNQHKYENSIAEEVGIYLLPTLIDDSENINSPKYSSVEKYVMDNLLNYIDVINRPKIRSICLEKLYTLTPEYLSMFGDLELMKYFNCYISYSSRFDLITKLYKLIVTKNFFVPFIRKSINQETILYTDINEYDTFMVAYGTLNKYTMFELEELDMNFKLIKLNESENSDNQNIAIESLAIRNSLSERNNHSISEEHDSQTNSIYADSGSSNIFGNQYLDTQYTNPTYSNGISQYQQNQSASSNNTSNESTGVNHIGDNMSEPPDIHISGHVDVQLSGPSGSSSGPSGSSVLSRRSRSLSSVNSNYMSSNFNNIFGLSNLVQSTFNTITANPISNWVSEIIGPHHYGDISEYQQPFLGLRSIISGYINQDTIELPEYDATFKIPNNNVEFSAKELTELHKILCEYRKDMIGNTKIIDKKFMLSICSKIEKGVEYRDMLDNFRANLTNNINKLNSIDRAIIKEWLLTLFDVGMYMRRWKGPGYQYPILRNKTTEKSARTLNNDLNYKVIVIDNLGKLASIEHKMSSNLYKLVRNLSAYELRNGSIIAFKHPIAKYISNVAYNTNTDSSCIRVNSTIFIGTAYVYLKFIFNQAIDGFNVNIDGIQ